MKRAIATMAALLVALTGCAERQGQNTYKDSEIGVSRAVEFGTVLNVRDVHIVGKNTGAGTLVGAGAGAGAGSYIGSGSGNIWATVGAGLIGAAAGTVAEQQLQDRDGLEYVVQLQSGEVKTVTQEKTEGDVVFKEGDHVMLQYCDAGDHARKCAEGQYQRLLPIKKLPPYVKKKKKFVQTDETSGS